MDKKIPEKRETMSHNVVSISLNDIQVPARQRIIEDGDFAPQSIKEMAESIKKIGLIEPIKISVVKGSKCKYRVVSGARRCRACLHAGLKYVEAVVIPDTEDTLLKFLIENTQRENILPIVEADTYKELLDTGKISQAELAEKICKPQIYITQRLRLLKLPESIAFLLYNGMLTEGMVEQLFRVEDIINALVTTDYMKDELYKIEQEEFKNWVESWQNHFAWEYESTTVEKMKLAVDEFYYDIMRASSDRYTDKLERELLPQAKNIKKKVVSEWTAEEKRIMDELTGCIYKRMFKPVIKRDEDREFIVAWAKEHCPS